MQGKQNCICVPASGVQFFCVRAPMLLGHNSTVVKCTFNSPIGCTEDKEDGRGFSFELHFYAAEQNWKSQSTEAAYSIPCIPLTRGRVDTFSKHSHPFSFSGPKSVSFCEEGK